VLQRFHRPSHTTVIAYLALFAAVGGGAIAIGQAGGGSETINACVIKRGDDRGQLRVLTKGKCKRKKERALTWNQRGPAGERGQPGPQGLTGPPGSPAGSMLMGWIQPMQLPPPGGATDLSPLGNSAASIGGLQATPNAPTVFRDLFVRALSPPGGTSRWRFTLQGNGAEDVIECEIFGSFATTCDSGNQSFTVPAGGTLRLQVANVDGATPAFIYYAYRAETP
jgi:hypothetical protein